MLQSEMLLSEMMLIKQIDGEEDQGDLKRSTMDPLSTMYVKHKDVKIDKR